MARPPVATADRAAMRCTGWVFASLAAVSLVSTIFAAVSWWHVAGREDVTGGARTWPAVAVLLVGTTLTLSLYGLSRLCHVVVRLCREAVAEATTPVVAMRPRPPARPTPSPTPTASSVTGSGAARF